MEKIKSTWGGKRLGAGRRRVDPEGTLSKKQVCLDDMTLRKLKVLDPDNLSAAVRKAAEIAYERYQRD